MTYPIICKAARVIWKTLRFRNAELADADFILLLRTDANKSRYLSSVSINFQTKKHGCRDMHFVRRWLILLLKMKPQSRSGQLNYMVA